MRQEVQADRPQPDRARDVHGRGVRLGVFGDRRIEIADVPISWDRLFQVVVAARVTSEEFAGGLLNMLAWPMMLLSGVFGAGDTILVDRQPAEEGDGLRVALSALGVGVATEAPLSVTMCWIRAGGSC